MDATCERCGKSFRTYPSRVRDGKARYCSKACQWPESVRDRFVRFVNKDGPVPPHRPELGPCWLWTGRLNDGGYGTFKIKRRNWLAHRVAWVLWCVRPSFMTIVYPEIERGDAYQERLRDESLWNTEQAFLREYDICHHCDVRPCIRPTHLFMGTAQDNMDDMFAKGRAPDRHTSALKAWETKRANGTDRKMQCGRGHEMSPENTYTAPDGTRRCRQCLRLKDQRRKPRLRSL